MFFFKKKASYAFMDIGLVTDVHSHILPGVDDGSDGLEESVSILTELQRLGVRRCIFTPHVSRSMFPNTAPDLSARFEAFIPTLPEEIRSGMQFHLASEYMVDEFFGGLTDRLYWPDGRILIEMSYYQRSREIRQTIFDLRMQGRQPVLAHPERYVFYQKAFDRRTGKVDELEELVDMGCELQLNVMSLTGAYGTASLAIARWLLDAGMYRFIGTDVHSRGQIDHFTGFQINAAQMDRVRQLACNNDTLFE